MCGGRDTGVTDAKRAFFASARDTGRSCSGFAVAVAASRIPTIAPTMELDKFITTRQSEVAPILQGFSDPVHEINGKPLSYRRLPCSHNQVTLEAGGPFS